MGDPGSLQNLNDIVAPAPVAWWPLAPGWYALAGILLLALFWLGFRRLRSWQQNRYRREALRALAQIAASGPVDDAAQHPVEVGPQPVDGAAPDDAPQPAAQRASGAALEQGVAQHQQILIERCVA